MNGNVIELKGQTKTITPISSQQVVTPDSGYNGLTEVRINAIPSPMLQNKSVEITENGTTNVNPDEGYDGLSSVAITTNVGSASYPPDWSQIGYNTPPQIILDDFSYSKEIADNWDSSLTSLNSMFNNNKTLKYMPLVDTGNVISLNSTWNGSSVIEIPLLDTSKVRGWVQTFANCYNLTKIPSISMAGATYGSSAMGIKQTFYYCSNLVDVPVLDVSNATVLDKMFENCPKLSDESLNNIMQMCINSKITNASYKTLKAVGLSSTQATKCQSLSNWSALQAKGWTTGY